MIYTAEQIECIASKVSGTWVKRANTRKRLTRQSNESINIKIDLIKKEIRKNKANGAKEKDLRELYAEITKLEVRIL